MAARMWSKPLFRTAFPGNDVSATVRRSLASIDQDSPALKKMREAAEAIGIKYESPFHYPDCYAHFAIPQKKLAIFMRQSTDTTQFARIKKMWDESKFAKGWQLVFTTNRQVEQMPADDLARNLASQVGGMKR